MNPDPRVLEINRLLKEQHDRKKTRDGRTYDGNAVPDRVRDDMVAQLRAVLMTLKIEQEMKGQA